MGKIKLLTPHEIHKIAAGEVVERPANVIKELVENSLDAGATTITVFAEQGGKALLRVVDNGCGMSPEDAHMSIKHHATSKITAVDDLISINTFGFRGEALSSITAVSKVTLITKEEHVLEGTQLTIREGSIIAQEPCASRTGTDITVAELFHNVPARRKFLKSDDTELRTLCQLMTAFSLSYPACSFMLYHHQRLLLECKSTDSLRDRLGMLFDVPYVQASLDCSLGDEMLGFSIEGTCTTPDHVRYDRSGIFIFVNKRWVKNSKLTSSVIKGYAGTLPPAKYPSAVISITIDPEQVDINIHPRKEEVQFLHPRRIELALEKAVHAALEQRTTELVRPAHSVEINTQQGSVAFGQSPTREIIQPQTNRQTLEQFKHIIDLTLEPQREQALPVQADIGQQHLAEGHQDSLAKTDLQKHVQKPTDTERIGYRLIGRIRETYILLENDQGLVLIDQHAAHERVLYELFEHRFASVAVMSLLFPPVISLSIAEGQALGGAQSLFKQFGITIEQYGQQEYIVRTAPVMLKDQRLDELIKQMLATISEQAGADKQLFEKSLHHALRAQMACKAAVKAGDHLPNELIHELIESLSTTNNRFSCPHGRPTSWTITDYEIEKKFKRVG